MRLKENKGITLIALIITIVILLILAVVTIMAVNGDGIIAKAKQAREEYQNAQSEEQGILDRYLAEMEGLIGNNTSTGENTLPEGENPGETTITWTDNGDGTFTSSYGITVAIGDKVAYNEGSGKTSNIDSSFVMKDMEWRILDIEEDGTIELISTQPTDSTLTLSGEDGWLNAETKLDTLCNDLYANGTGVTARSLKVEDINKLGNYDPTTRSNYGSLWRYKYDPTAGKIQYSKSTDKGSTWIDYANSIINYKSFKAPGEAEINSTNYQDSNGNPIVKELESNDYYYTIAYHVFQTTTDGIRMASLISQGLNDTNDAESGSSKEQWLSSRNVNCDSGMANFNVCNVRSGDVNFYCLWSSYGSANSPAYAVRPVVSLPSEVQMTKVDGIWQVNI